MINLKNDTHVLTHGQQTTNWPCWLTGLSVIHLNQGLKYYCEINQLLSVNDAEYKKGAHKDDERSCWAANKAHPARRAVYQLFRLTKSDCWFLFNRSLISLIALTNLNEIPLYLNNTQLTVFLTFQCYTFGLTERSSSWAMNGWGAVVKPGAQTVEGGGVLGGWWNLKRWRRDTKKRKTKSRASGSPRQNRGPEFFLKIF